MEKNLPEGYPKQDISIKELCDYLENGQYNIAFNLTNDYIENFILDKYPKLIEDINTDYGYDYKKKTRIFIGKQSMENLIKHVFPLRLISLSLGDINISNEEKLKMLDSTYDTMKNRKDIVPIGDKDWKKIENDYSYHKRHIEVPVSIERSIN